MNDDDLPCPLLDAPFCIVGTRACTQHTSCVCLWGTRLAAFLPPLFFWLNHLSLSLSVSLRSSLSSSKRTHRSHTQNMKMIYQHPSICCCLLSSQAAVACALCPVAPPALSLARRYSSSFYSLQPSIYTCALFERSEREHTQLLSQLRRPKPKKKRKKKVTSHECPGAILSLYARWRVCCIISRAFLFSCETTTTPLLTTAYPLFQSTH